MYACTSAHPFSEGKELYLPDNLGHIQRLSDSELEDGTDSLKVFDSAFNLCPLDPGRAEGGVVLVGQLRRMKEKHQAYRQELLIQRPDSIELS